MSVDYIDFVDAHGDEYIGALSHDVSTADRGALQLRVRCTMSLWSDANNQGADPADGHAAFLPVGTPVYAVKGSSPDCRLMARADDGWHLYTATANPSCAKLSPPVATALPPQPVKDRSLANCPKLAANGPREGAVTDVGDFVQWREVPYVKDYRFVVTKAAKGTALLRVRCSLNHLNTVTHRLPPTARNGDAGVLPAGTAVFSVKDVPTRCQLMALETGRWFVYTPRPTPAGCPRAGVR
jgi:hypothetical protein